MSETTTHSEQQAIAQLESIREMVAGLNSQDDDTRERAIQQIQEDPLSIEVRSDWHAIGEQDVYPVEYQILLCAGGPACRIVGELNEHAEPEAARIEHQDWGTPWTEYRHEDPANRVADTDALLAYARQFYFHEA